jgi:3',5'-cyclic AMP phosphodiesterase CpdA
MRTIVHLSDLHFGRVDSRMLPPLVRVIHAIAPHLIAVSGDLTQRARPREFAQARAFLQELPVPQIVVPGNHDVPLYDVARRLLRPLARYRRYISNDLEPVFEDAEMIVVGLNSVRSMVWKSGRLNAGQVGRAVAHLASAPPAAVRVVVTHHPFDVPEGHRDHGLIGRARMAMAQLAPAGVDVFLAGHLHVSHVGRTAERYRIGGYNALVVQAGTLSTRGRGEPIAFNVVRLASSVITVERHTRDETTQTFLPSWTRTFHRTPEGWIAGGGGRE